jgi:hypothetical protein
MALTNGFLIRNEGVMIKLTKGETKLMLNQRLNVNGGFVSGVKMVHVLNQVGNNISEEKEIDQDYVS